MLRLRYLVQQLIACLTSTHVQCLEAQNWSESLCFQYVCNSYFSIAMSAAFFVLEFLYANT